MVTLRERRLVGEDNALVDLPSPLVDSRRTMQYSYFPNWMATFSLEPDQNRDVEPALFVEGGDNRG